MKQCNIIKSFETGWVVGLSDHNQVLVESPSGDVVEPYYNHGPHSGVFGHAEGGEVISIKDPQVVELVQHLWDKQELARKQAEAAGEVTESESDPREIEPATLEDYGFEEGETIKLE